MPTDTGDVGNTPTSTVFRTDSAPVKSFRRTPQGGLVVEATLTRSGVFMYVTPNGVVREYRPDSEVFNPESLATLADAPITDNHPVGLVDVSNHKDLSRGNVRNGTVRKDGNHVYAELVIQDAELIKAIESRKRKDVSCGYLQVMDSTPGTTPEGEPYDRIQRSIVYNHVAIVEKGRAGTATIRLDSAGNEVVSSTDGVNMDEIAQLKAQLAAEKARADAAEKGVKDILSDKANTDKESARADAAELKVKELEGKLGELTDPKRLDSMIHERFTLIDSARKILGKDVRLDGINDHDIRVQVVNKAFPSIKLDGKSPEYIQGLYTAATERGDSVGNAQVNQTVNTPNTPNTTQDAKKRFDAYVKTAAQQPLALSKDAKSV